MAAGKVQDLISGATPKQKAIGVVFIIVVLIVIWQVVGLFGGSSKEEVVKQPNNKAMQPISTSMPGNNMMMGATPSPVAPVTTAAMPQQQQQMTTTPVAEDLELLKLQRDTQGKYVNALNDLQMLKIQKDIADNNQSIAKAQFEAETAKKNTRDLLNRAGGVAGTLPYQVVSVSMQLNKWSAVIKYDEKQYDEANKVVGVKNKQFTVYVGDVLDDESKVIAINKNGIVLKKEDEIRKIPLIMYVNEKDDLMSASTASAMGTQQRQGGMSSNNMPITSTPPVVGTSNIGNNTETMR